MELRARGWSVRGAAREIGISRTAANNWARGYKTFRNGGIVGFVPPLERLAVRQISDRFLSQDERIEIADLHQASMSIRQISQRLGGDASTISRELCRNAVGGGHGGYRPFDAHRRAVARRARDHRRRIEKNAELRRVVGELLMQRWSRQQISRHLRSRFPDDPASWLCHRVADAPEDDRADSRLDAWHRGDDAVGVDLADKRVEAFVEFLDLLGDR